MRKYLTKLFLRQFGDRDELLLFVVRDLFNGITTDDLLVKLSDGSIRYKDKKIDQEGVVQLQEDSEKVRNSLIWKILMEDAKYRANQNLQGSPDWNGVVFARAMLHAIDTIEERLAQISNFKTK